MTGVKFYQYFTRVSLFLIYFWFGILKLFGNSPANGLVQELLDKVMPFIPFEYFIIFLGIFEMAIGVMFLIPKITKITIIITGAHLISTFLPLLLLMGTTWNGFLTFSIEGQYIFKNLLIISALLGLNTAFKDK